jgi:D-alanine-D-alanine ligase
MKSKNNTTVAVLLGGWSGEREVSLTSGEQVALAAEALGYNVRRVDVTRDLSKLIAQLTPKPDVIINILHGQWGEDGRIQSVLDILDIPYTFSGHTASALAMDKHLSKQIFLSSGLPTPRYKIASFEDAFATPQMTVPYVIKPIAEGSSLGVYIVPDPKVLPTRPADWSYGDKVMVEEYIPGQEISVAVMGDKALGALELAPKEGFYDYEAKYTDGKTIHHMPARMPEEDYKKALDLALKAHQALTCRGVTRTDIRYNPETRELFVLEVNTQPGFTPLSIVPEIAAHVGYSFSDLVGWMIEDAMKEDHAAQSNDKVVSA